MKTSPTHMATPPTGGRFRELPDGSFEAVPEDAPLRKPVKKAKAKVQAKPAAAERPRPKAAPPPPKEAEAQEAPVETAPKKDSAHD